MPRFAEDYTFYTRAMKDGRRVYYYRARDPETGARLPGRSTGKINERDALRVCERLKARGELIPAPKAPKPPAEVRRSRRPPTLAEWVAERHFFEWEKDKPPACLYCQGELKRSSEGAPAIQRGHADRSRRVLVDEILPQHGRYRIDQISPLMCEDLLAAWSAAGLANKTLNNWASVYRVVMAEAARLGVVPVSPWAEVKGYRPDKGGKGVLTVDEFRALMHPASLDARWTTREAYEVNLLAALTGLRLGECLALHPADVFADHIVVSASWDMVYGEGPQKTKRGTDQIPVPGYLGKLLVARAALCKRPEDYIFAISDDRKRPMAKLTVERALYAALASIGITPEERKARRVSFHSWRAFANTFFRASGVPDSKVRAITRHETEAMTEHYSAFRLEDFREVAEAQAALVRELEGNVVGKGITGA